MKLFMTSGMNWGKGHICGAHWSKSRENSQIYQILLFQRINMIKYVKNILAKKIFESYKNPNYKLKLRYKTAIRIFEVATEIKKTLFLKNNENKLKEM